MGKKHDPAHPEEPCDEFPLFTDLNKQYLKELEEKSDEEWAKKHGKDYIELKHGKEVHS